MTSPGTIDQFCSIFSILSINSELICLILVSIFEPILFVYLFSIFCLESFIFFVKILFSVVVSVFAEFILSLIKLFSSSEVSLLSLSNS